MTSKFVVLLILGICCLQVSLQQTPDYCLLPSEMGPCKALMFRYYYTSAGTCEEFIYGGCGGNKNNFNTKDECLQACKH